MRTTLSQGDLLCWKKGFLAIIFLTFILSCFLWLSLKFPKALYFQENLIVSEEFGAQKEKKKNLNFSSSLKERLPVEVERKKFVFLRVLGNDLPPRHHPIQTQMNLQFILENEKEFPQCEKIWILNRIVDKENENVLIKLLESYKKRYYRIPFIFEEYQEHPFEFTWSEKPEDSFRLMSPRCIVCNEIFHSKNLYAMNNNGARNYALELGKKLGKWVLPFDGNLFFTKKNWEVLEAEINEIEKSNKDIRYLTIPMVRMGKFGANLGDVEETVYSKNEIEAEEPQILFRFDSTNMYDPKARYGRRPKVELLHRLGQWPPEIYLPWEKRFIVDKNAATQVQKSQSFIIRLPSGNSALELSGGKRGSSRTRGILSFLESLETKIYGAHFKKDFPILYDFRVLEKEKALYFSSTPTSELIKIVDSLHLKAKEILKTFKVLSFRKNVLMRPKSFPVTFNKTVSALQSQLQNMTILTLASYFSIDDSKNTQNIYSTKVISQLTYWFLSDHAYSPISTGDSEGFGNLLSKVDLHYFLDSIKILHLSNKISNNKYFLLSTWFKNSHLWFKSNSIMETQSKSLHEIGTKTHLQLISLSAFANFRDFIWHSHFLKSRILAQNSPRSQITFKLENLIQNVNSLINIATIANNINIDLWTWDNGKWNISSTQFASEKLLTTNEERQLNSNLLAYIHHEANSYLEKGQNSDLLVQVHALLKGISIVESDYLNNQVYEPHFSVRPFWYLGNHRNL